MKLTFIRGGKDVNEDDDTKGMMIRGMFAVTMRKTHFDDFNMPWNELPNLARQQWRVIARNLFNLIRGKESDETIKHYIEKNIRGARVNLDLLVPFIKRCYALAHSKKN